MKKKFKRLVSIFFAFIFAISSISVLPAKPVESADSYELPTLQENDAKQFLGLVYNSKNWDKEEFSEIFLDLITGKYDRFKSVDELILVKQAFSIFVRTSLNKQIGGSEQKLNIINKDLVDLLSKRLGKMKDLDESAVGEYVSFLEDKIEDTILDLMLCGVAKSTGFVISENTVKNINLGISSYNQLVNAPQKAVEYVENIVAALEAGMYVFNGEVYGRTTYLNLYLRHRPSYSSPDDIMFDYIMEYNAFALSDNTYYSNFIDFTTWITGKDSWNDHIEDLNRWGEFLYCLETADLSGMLADDVLGGANGKEETTEEENQETIKPVEIWDGKLKTKVEPVGDIYLINTMSKLAWLGDVLNSGKINFSDYIIEITGDLDLNKKSWSAISVKDTYLKCQKLYIHDCNFTNFTKSVFGTLKIDNIQVVNVEFKNFEFNQTDDMAMLALGIEIGDKGKFYAYDVSLQGNMVSAPGYYGYAGWFGGGARGTLLIDLKVGSDADVRLMYIDVNVNCTGAEGGMGGLIARTKKIGSGGKIHISRSSIRGNFDDAYNYGYSSVFCGGIIGEAIGNDIVIEECTVNGTFNAAGHSSWCGGMIAKVATDSLIIRNSYLNVSVSSHASGGIIGSTSINDDGKSIIENCFVVGRFRQAFVTLNSADNGIPVKSCYFDYQKSTVTDPNVKYSKDSMYANGALSAFYSVNVTKDKLIDCKGLTSEEAIIKSNFKNWDFTDIWAIDDSGPVLKWQNSGMNPPVFDESLYDKVGDTSSDEAIIEEVRKYTSSAITDSWINIMESNLSDDEKFRRLSELSSNMGLTDPLEGIEYLQNSSAERWAYKFLLTDDAFTSYQLRKHVNSDPVAKASLVASSLIFNNELLDHFDFTNYKKDGSPGVKKYKTLLKNFMEVDNENVITDGLGIGKKTADIYKNLYELNDKVEENVVKPLIESMNGADRKKLNTLQKQFADILFQSLDAEIIGDDGRGKMINLEANGISDALDYSETVISFMAETAEDITAMVNLEQDIQTYKEHKHFLETICNSSEISGDMRKAAYEILDDMENGYMKRVVSILSNVINTGVDLGTTLLDTNTLELMGFSSISEFVSTYKVAVAISNIFVDTGEFVREAAYTIGYAELAELFSKELQLDEKAFLANPTADNAWKFYEDYNLLWRLRYNGEKQSLKMQEVKILFVDTKLKDYDYKKDVIDSNLNILQQCTFSLAPNNEMPDHVQYLKKYVISCPVDVEVYNSSGDLIAILKDGVTSDITNSYGRFAVVKQNYSGEFAKVICLMVDEDISIKLIGTEDGLVSYQQVVKDSDMIYEFNNVAIKKGELIEINGLSVNQNQTSIPLNQIDTSNYEKVSSVDIEENTIEIKVGENKTMTVSVLPNTANNKELSWYSEDETVAVVKNGVILGKKPGETKIKVKAYDGDNTGDEITVRVVKESERQENGNNLNSNGNNDYLYGGGNFHNGGTSLVIPKPTPDTQTDGRPGNNHISNDSLSQNGTPMLSPQPLENNESQNKENRDRDNSNSERVIYTPLYRLFNPASGEHLYTVDSREVKALVDMGWIEEESPGQALNKGVAVYRLHNPATGGHLYTTDKNECRKLTRKYGWFYDNNKKPVFFGSRASGKPVYRLYNPLIDSVAANHHYTSDIEEVKKLTKDKGWQYDNNKEPVYYLK